MSDGVEVYQRARELAVALRQHVFDTLYHAVALSRLDGVLLTADEQYYRCAAGGAEPAIANPGGRGPTAEPT